MRIVRAGSERIDDLQPLWESLHEHHATIAPHLTELGPVRTPDDSWAVRRALYEDWLAEPDAFVLLAESEGEPVGYALVHMRGPEETWETGDRVGVLETLAVLPGERGRGIGSSLFERIYAELRKLGVTELQVAVISKNAAALRFYERHGLLPFTVSFLGRVTD
jgi:ribosomal protein S18 acetylase RimI-like enzyme